MMAQQPSTSREQRRMRTFRLTILLALLAISTIIGILHQHLPFGKAPVGVDALCPFGAIESAFTLITTGAMLQRIAVSSFILLAAVLVSAVIFRRSFCGYICPLGALQEIFSRLGRRILKRAYRLPTVVDRPARWVKYLVLAVVVIGSARAAELIIRPYDPWVAYHHLTSTEIWTEFPWGVGILVVTLLGALIFNRVFCKYLCPMGAVLGLLSPFSLTRIRRNAATCIQCHRCDGICPVDIDVSRQTVISSPECLDCHECVNVCPVTETLAVENRRRKYVSVRIVLGAVTTIFLATIGATSAARIFEWTTVPIAAQTAQSGAFDPAAIRGKMLFADVIAASGVPEEVVMERFTLTRDDLRTPIKDAAMKYGFTTEDVRDFLDAYRAGNDSESRREQPLTTSTVAFDPQSITGTMTLEEVATASGVPMETLLTQFPVSIADRNLPLKQLKERYNFDTQAVRDFVTATLQQ